MFTGKTRDFARAHERARTRDVAGLSMPLQRALQILQ
jgi:hypothetical protein